MNKDVIRKALATEIEAARQKLYEVTLLSRERHYDMGRRWVVAEQRPERVARQQIERISVALARVEAAQAELAALDASA